MAINMVDSRFAFLTKYEQTTKIIFFCVEN